MTLSKIQVPEVGDTEGSWNAAFSRKVYDLVGRRCVDLRRHDGYAEALIDSAVIIERKM